ncbi:PucR family transcriptional regulator [Pseudonocardia nantongensis]|uniref:PucR family transcriptional regulator n=1 Tax=Pseudonocardia nantongensis TaxID=1181885 RepID=UPI00397ACBAF
MYPSIADVLALPAVRAGAPAVRAGRPELDTEVRWVHVSELAEPAGTLPPGVLVLSVGLALSDPTTDPARYLGALRAAGAVGLLVELGQQLTALPADLVQAARSARFPLVEVRRTVRYAEIIETVLGRILNSQHDRASFAERAGGAFRTLALHGAGADRIVAEAAALLGRPVVLEDLAHRVPAVAGADPETDLRDWATRSRLAPTGDDAGPEGWTVRPVGTPESPWGRIVVPARPAPDPAAREATVLALAADALTLSGHADPVTLLAAARAALLRELAGATQADVARLAARIRAAGVDTTGTFEVLALAQASGTPVAGLRDAVTGPGADAVAGGGPAPVAGDCGDRLLVLVPGSGRAGDLLRELPAALVGTAAAAGPAGFDRVPELMREAQAVLAARAATTPPGERPGVAVAPSTGAAPHAHRRSELGVRELVWRLRDDPRLLGFVADQLGPVLGLDPAERDRALTGLRAWACSGGVVADFARRIGVGRPAAYARLARLSELVGADLTDPEVRTSLHVALLAAPG